MGQIKNDHTNRIITLTVCIKRLCLYFAYSTLINCNSECYNLVYCKNLKSAKKIPTKGEKNGIN